MTASAGSGDISLTVLLDRDNLSRSPMPTDIAALLTDPPPGWERFTENGRSGLRLDRSRSQLHGKAYFDYPEGIKRLKRENRLDEAAGLLEQLVIVVEDEAAHSAFGTEWKLAPWYYEQLAIVYRKLKRYGDEALILERYIRHPNAIADRSRTFLARQQKALSLGNLAS